MNHSYEERLGTDPMLRLIFRMALPAVAAQFVNLLYAIVDRVYIGHIPGIGTDALAGVGVTMSIVILISSFSAIVGAGGAPLAAIALGQGNRERAGKILGNGFVLLLLFTVVTSSLAYLFMEPVLLLTGASEHTLGYAEDYLSVYLLGTLFVELSVGLNAFINTQGRPGIAMTSVLIGAAMNIVLDPVFIFGLDMGVKGAALATILSQACSAGWVLRFLFSRQASLPLERRYMKLDKGIVWVNNISKKKLLGSLPSLKASLFAMQVIPKVPTRENDNPFLAELEANMRETLSWIANYSGIYISYSLSSTSQAMKVEPYLIAPAEKGNYVEVIHNNVYGTTHHGAALMNGTNHLYLAFNEHKTPQLALFHISLKLPMYDRPPFLRGVYTCFDYNYNPIARRILFVKVSESVARDEFMKLKGQLKTYDQLDEKEKRYYQYTCQPEDIIRICNIPSPTMTEEDLDMEKKLLTISK